MKIVEARTWPLRLLAAAGLSVALHLLIVAWLPRPGDAPLPAQGEPLVLRLVPQGAPHGSATHAAAAHRHPVTSAKAGAPATPLPGAAPARGPSAAPLASLAPANAPQPVDGPVPAGVPDPGPSAMPSRYRVRMPPPGLLSYSVTRAAPGQPARAGAPASLAWQSDGERYQLRFDGVLGQLASTGRSGDAGIAPEQASERAADGTTALTRFDAASNNMLFDRGAASYPISAGSQDRASVLMQLAGIGLAEPDQMHDVLEVVVAGAREAAIARFQVLGLEQVDTGVGTLESWHLAELARPGQRRLEVWLAPRRNWYPVQLRVTEPDGTVATQVLRAIGPAAPLP
jgi:hypothetical protein